MWPIGIFEACPRSFDDEGDSATPGLVIFVAFESDKPAVFFLGKEVSESSLVFDDPQSAFAGRSVGGAAFAFPKDAYVFKASLGPGIAERMVLDIVSAR